MHGRAQVEFGLHVLYVGEPDIYTVETGKNWLENKLWACRLWPPQVLEICTAFQN